MSPKNSKEKPDKENVDPNKKNSEGSQDNRGDYRDIHLDEIKDEIPCYDNATTVRRKFNKLLSDKTSIPGTDRKWSKASMVDEMQELEKRGHPVR